MSDLIYEYTLKEILYTIRHKEELEYRAAVTGNMDLLDGIIDSEYIIKNAELTPKQMQTFSLYYYDDYTLDKIGDMFNTSHQSVADCLTQCKKKIKNYLKRCYNNDYQ